MKANYSTNRGWFSARPPRKGGKHVMFMDGECSFCQHTARVLSSLDTKNVIHFSSLQGETAVVLPEEWRVTESDGKSVGAVVLLEQQAGEKDRLWRGADAALRLLYLIGGLWSLLWVLHWIPACIKNPIYNLISRHRLKLVSKECPLPSPEQKERFLP